MELRLKFYICYGKRIRKRNGPPVMLLSMGAKFVLAIMVVYIQACYFDYDVRVGKRI